MVQIINLAVALVATASTVQAAPIEKRQSGCSSYIIIDTRGTGEMQGPSAGFRTMNKNIQSKMPGGSVYNTVYSAGITQVSTKGTEDIVRKVTTTLASAPGTCFVLEGYSQGAAATTNAMSKLTGTAFDAVKAVFLIGNPEHHKGKACNVDTEGGQKTMNVNGMSAALGGIPDNWVSKTLDVCNYVRLPLFPMPESNHDEHETDDITANHSTQGDGVCDTTHGFGINAQHLAYPMSASTQNLGTQFVLKQLSGASTSAATPAASAGSSDSSESSDSSSGSGLSGLSGLGGSGSSSGSGGLSGLLSGLGKGTTESPTPAASAGSSSTTGSYDSSSSSDSSSSGGLSGLSGLGGSSSGSSGLSGLSGLSGGSSGLGGLSGLGGGSSSSGLSGLSGLGGGSSSGLGGLSSLGGGSSSGLSGLSGLGGGSSSSGLSGLSGLSGGSSGSSSPLGKLGKLGSYFKW
jgi:hypothetical protein